MQEALRKFKAEIFHALAHPTRIAILELLRDGEVPVAHIYETLKIEPANASQHLAVMRAKLVVVSRKEGNQVFYTIRDRSIIQVLDIMRRYFEEHLAESLAMLNDLSIQSAQQIIQRQANGVTLPAMRDQVVTTEPAMR